jgi:exo-beta-1,3-glucanase (GH17 family)
MIMMIALIRSFYVAPEEALSRELQSHCWIGYNPKDFRPDHPSVPPEAIRRELQCIRRAGFTGIVTFASTGSLVDIPRLAKEEGMSVIMGVWNPNHPRELIAAASQKEFVFGYSVGHDGLDFRYLMPELVQAVQYLRRVTGRPVTTTEEAKDYDEPGEDRLSVVGDWLFPDVHMSLMDRPEPLKESDIPLLINELMQSVRKVELLGRKLHRPVMLKMLSFPCGGTRGTSNELQRVYFREAIQTFQDPHHGLRIGASWMVHGAFDEGWKVRGRYCAWDRFTGLFEATGCPRPAVAEEVRLCQ